MGQKDQRLGGIVGIQLSVMMFLQFFIWGAWYVSMTGFINKHEMGPLTAAAYTVGPIAAIASPFFLGIFADRFFATQRVLAVMHLLGGLVLFAVPAAAAKFSGGGFEAFSHPFIILLLIHMLCYMPTLGLSSSLAMHNMNNAERQFPIIRVFGTIGWIVGNIAVSLLPGQDASASQFYLAGGAGIVLAVFSMTLPNTPAPSKGTKAKVRDILGLDSLALLKDRSYAIFIACSFLLVIPLAGYYVFARNFVEATNSGINGSAVFAMSFGQMSEILFMLVMPLCFIKLGVKWMLAVGMAAWVVRYGLFAGAADDQIKWMVLSGIILHGICYDFFFVTGQIYVDNMSNSKIRGQAQGFFVLLTQGLGMLIGAQIFGKIFAKYTTTVDEVTTTDWQQVWVYPAAFAMVILVVFVVLFKNPTPSSDTENTDA